MALLHFTVMKELFYKILGKRYTWFAIYYRQTKTYIASVIHPYHYDPKRYDNSFLEEKCEFSFEDDFSKSVNRVIYIFWTGENDITPNRLAGIESLRKVSGVDVKLITPQNLSDYIKDDDPLPEAYQFLSLNHRSDYLRSYFMYHYGGGYADIKTYFKSWVPAFEKLDKSDAYVIGYPEVGFWGAAQHDVENVNLKNDLCVHWRLLVGNGAFICRPHTKMAAEWHTAVRNRLFGYTEQLKQHPARDTFGKNADYPIPWGGMQGEIFHPFCLKYNKRLLKDKALLPSFKNYR